MKLMIILWPIHLECVSSPFSSKIQESLFGSRGKKLWLSEHVRNPAPPLTNMDVVSLSGKHEGN